VFAGARPMVKLLISSSTSCKPLIRCCMYLELCEAKPQTISSCTSILSRFIWSKPCVKRLPCYFTLRRHSMPSCIRFKLCSVKLQQFASSTSILSRCPWYVMLVFLLLRSCLGPRVLYYFQNIILHRHGFAVYFAVWYSLC
jgi:hypothetical protein